MCLSASLITTASDRISVGDAAIYALLGYAVVFFGLILLQLVIIALGKFFASKSAKSKEAALASVPEVPAVQQAVAPGSAGSLKLYDVEPKTAAMLMAIVANHLGKPLNELRFISIKEVK